MLKATAAQHEALIDLKATGIIVADCDFNPENGDMYVSFWYPGTSCPPSLVVYDTDGNEC